MQQAAAADTRGLPAIERLPVQVHAGREKLLEAGEIVPRGEPGADLGGGAAGPAAKREQPSKAGLPEHGLLLAVPAQDHAALAHQVGGADRLPPAPRGGDGLDRRCPLLRGPP